MIQRIYGTTDSREGCGTKCIHIIRVWYESMIQYIAVSHTLDYRVHRKYPSEQSLHYQQRHCQKAVWTAAAGDSIGQVPRVPRSVVEYNWKSNQKWKPHYHSWIPICSGILSGYDPHTFGFFAMEGPNPWSYLSSLAPVTASDPQLARPSFWRVFGQGLGQAGLLLPRRETCMLDA